VLIASNRFLGTSTGVRVSSGHPTLRENSFQGNTVAVDVQCNPLYISDCAPHVSPGNRFIGAGQHGVINRHPTEGCVEATGNWWGHETGPKDWSSEQDPCGLVDNPGGGAVASDGVNYSPWQGSVARPLIVWPSCGVTARQRPTVEGRSQSGATVTFYDSPVELGQTICEEDHSFRWTPTEPLTDGLHIISAQAAVEGAASLPSPELPLTVDPSLAFDPAGIRISYSMHNVVYTQPLRDASGCASIGGDVRTPLWLREGAPMIVTVPIRNSPPVEPMDVQEGAIRLAKPTAVPESIPWNSSKITVPFHNNTNHIIEYALVAIDSESGPGTYRRVKLKRPLPPRETLHQAIDAEGLQGSRFVDFAFETRPGRIVARQDSVPSWEVESGSLVATPPSEQGLGTVKILNNTGKKIVKLHFVWEEGGINYQTPGGSFASWQDPLSNTQSRSYTLPKGKNNTFWVVMEDEDGTIYWREVRLGAVNCAEPPTVDLSSSSNTQVNLTNVYRDEEGESKSVADIRVYRHREGEQPRVSRGLGLFNSWRRGQLDPNEGISLFLENSHGKTRYSFVGYDRLGKPVWYKTNIDLKGEFPRNWKIRRCPWPGR